MDTHSNASYWLQRARWVAVTVNAAWAWQRFLPYLVGINLIFAGYILVARRQGVTLDVGFFAYLTILVIGLAWAIFRARKFFFKTEDALLRIETALGLKSRLSSAAEGATTWPERTAFSEKVLGVRPHVAVLPVLYSLLFILVGLWLPIGQASATPRIGDAVEPSAWTEVADWAEILKEEKLIAEEAPKALEERLDQLRDRPKDEWYSQGSLEAGEALRDETRLSMQELARRLQSTSTFLDEMSKQQAMPLAGGIQPEALDKAWLEQLSQLKMSQPALDPAMLNQLNQLSFSQMKSLSPEQLKEMAERFKQCAGRCGGAAGLTELDMEKVALATMSMCQGGIQRGPGPAPMVMAEEGTGLETESREGVSNTDLRNAVLGETVGVSSRPGNEDNAEAFHAGGQSGTISGQGQGGDVVWKEFYMPAEQATLERYFK